MSFREAILDRVCDLLEGLVVEDAQVQEAPNGTIIITPNQDKVGVLRKVNFGVVENLPASTNDPIPVAFVDNERGRKDLGIDTFLTHIVEILTIRIDILLSRKIGIERTSRGESGVSDIPHQANDLLHDISNLVTQTNLSSAVHGLDTENTVHEVVLNEWERDERYLGGEKEVLILRFQAQVADLRQ